MSDTKAMLGPTEAGSKPAPVECPACSTPCAATLTFCGNCGARIASPLLRVGSVVGSYRLVSLLGEGGMGLVYLAEHTRLGRKVALKMLRPEMARDVAMVRRFFAEARAVNKILHPNIVEVTDFVEDARGDNYIIMELLAGVSLDKVIAQGVPPLSRSLPIAIQIASALGAVHDAGIVHRDLKPENVFLRERTNQHDVVTLLDFGIAKLMDGVNGVPVSRTAAGMIVGTPSYMSIEQAAGKDVNHLTDIYAFGVVLYEMVTGRLPYRPPASSSWPCSTPAARRSRRPRCPGCPTWCRPRWRR
ncbi:MAG: protein kinase [Deltaproteobacteria bacterium]|nr:protein kinase [Deltaproteobacteria bacterium]